MRSALLAAALLLLSVAPAQAADPVRLRIGVVGEIGSIDPATGTGAVAREVWRLQYPTLTALSLDTLSPIPGLASAWTPGADSSEWTYEIRPDATWSDGTPVTADDVVTSLERARDEDWPYTGNYFDRLDAAASGERTVRVRSDGPSSLPSLLLHVVPSHDSSGTVGAGNWRVVEYDDTEVRMAVVDRPGRPRLDEIVFRSYGNAGSLTDALADGDVDIAAGFAPRDYDALRQVDGVTAIHANDGDQWTLLNRLDDIEVRAAVASAIDRDRLVARAVAGVGRPATIPIVARDAQWAVDPDDVKSFPYLPGRALRFLERADPRPETITLSSDSDVIAELVTEALGAIGLETRRVESDADLVVVRRNPQDDPTPVLVRYTCEGDVWCDADFDAAYETFLGTSDLLTRVDAVHAMVTRLTEQAVEVPLFAPHELQAFRTDKITGMLREPDEPRLVAFWPSVEQYEQMVPTPPPGGEEVPTSTFVVIAVLVAGASGLALAVAARLRRRSAGAPEDADMEGARGGEWVTVERHPP